MECKYIDDLVVDQLLIILVPAVQLPDIFTHRFARMLRCSLTHHLEVNLTAGHVVQEASCEGTVLNVAENILHRLLGVFGDDLRTGYIVTEFSGVEME